MSAFITAQPDGTAAIQFDYPLDRSLLASMKEEVPGRRWDAAAKLWRAPLSDGLREWARSNRVPSSGNLTPVMDGITCHPVENWSWFEVRSSAAAFAPMKEELKKEGARWNPVSKTWLVPRTPRALELFGGYGIPANLMSQMPESVETSDGLYQHQAQVVELVRSGGACRILLADEPGLGKSATFLRSAQAFGADRVLVISPAVMREGWRREAERWVPDMQVTVLSGKPRSLDEVEGVCIVGVDSLTTWVSELRTWIRGAERAALAVDESHMAKNPKAKRTQAALSIAREVPGLRFAMTGTAMPADVRDIVPQLELLGMDGVVGGQFGIERFVRFYTDSKGRMTRTVKDGEELNRRLEASCLIRRRKADVLDLPSRSVVDVPTEASVAYRKTLGETVRSVVAQVRSKSTEAKAPVDLELMDEVLQAFSLTGAGLSAQTQLVHATGLAKVDAAVQKTISLTTAGEQVVVMAHHEDVREGIREGLENAGLAVGVIEGGQGDKARQRSIDEFQAGQLDVLVCSITAAGVGITLVASSQLVMAELPWTDATQTQAIDRVHRIGQDAPVTAWRLVAVGTTDEVQVARINRRARAAAAVLDGGDADAVDGHLLVEYLRPLVMEALNLSEPPSVRYLQPGEDDGTCF